MVHAGALFGFATALPPVLIRAPRWANRKRKSKFRGAFPVYLATASKLRLLSRAVTVVHCGLPPGGKYHRFAATLPLIRYGKQCKPLELENGRVHLTDIRFGATATFSCNEGYRLIGTTSAQCVTVGNEVDWDKEVPLCQAIPCPPPPGIIRGSHTGQSEQEFSYGSAVTYKCEKGVSLIGAASIYCTTKDNVNGQWSGPAPECKEKNTGTIIAIGKMPIILAVLITNLFIRQ
ncbi:complement component receptor 1-like protein isoform X2 [Gopherus flavomarginatus]|uniref:complement component receptor 1-like protein isoform X2 n=1 Tax=Gopherus flavomarginatus TaxID=286002 RepID=UPI0021CC3013|nr:complement component receptor 1-like protein isoform X2 [Gopherus flavomarginatus]